jgi:poly(A) polymerase
MAVPNDLSHPPPSTQDKLLEEAVEKFSVRQVKREALKDLKRKERVLQELESIFNAWVRQCAVEAGVGTEVNGVPVAGRLETSGSWKLAIHEKDADIDCVCVAPQFCSLELFFGPFSAMLKAHKDVTNFLPIPGAFVPIMTFDLREVNIDLLLAGELDKKRRFYLFTSISFFLALHSFL